MQITIPKVSSGSVDKVKNEKFSAIFFTFRRLLWLLQRYGNCIPFPFIHFFSFFYFNKESEINYFLLDLPIPMLTSNAKPFLSHSRTTLHPNSFPFSRLNLVGSPNIYSSFKVHFRKYHLHHRDDYCLIMLRSFSTRILFLTTHA